MKKKCSVCGREDADILCSHCGNVVCSRCYDAETGMCARCAGKSVSAGGTIRRPGLMVGGFALILMGLMVTSWGFILQGGGTVVLFPFVFSGVGVPAAVLLSLVFFALLTVTSVLPLYILLRRSEYSEWDEGIYTIHDSVISGGNSSESVEYMITTEVPVSLKDSIFIEEDEDSIMLLSSKDSSFVKTYDLPESFHVDDVESDYEGGFLLIRVRLSKDY
jgi:hypothetical protein